MKKTQRKKPKFYKGQVVTMTEVTEGYLFRVARVNKAPSGENQYLDETHEFSHGGIWHDEKDLRPLTTKEIGPRRERGQ